MVRGEVPDLPGVKKDQVVRIRDRLKAMEILLKWGFGKAPQHLELCGAVGGSKWDGVLESRCDEDLMAVIWLRDQLREREVVEGEGKVVEESYTKATLGSTCPAIPDPAGFTSALVQFVLFLRIRCVAPQS